MNKQFNYSELQYDFSSQIEFVGDNEQDIHELTIRYSDENGVKREVKNHYTVHELDDLLMGLNSLKQEIQFYLRRNYDF